MRTLEAGVGLSSLISLSDGHLRKLADTLHLIAMTADARSRDWERIRLLLEELRAINVPCVLWFAFPDGSYWTLEGGRQTASLAERGYFPHLLAGHAVCGDLVASKSTAIASAIVAVPVVDRDAVVGALGASVYLDKLSALLREEMALASDAIFYSFDASALVGLDWDNSLIFLEPRKLSPELDRAFGEMLAHSSGSETYSFRNVSRTVIYRKSAVTQWWYAFGFIDS